MVSSSNNGNNMISVLVPYSGYGYSVIHVKHTLKLHRLLSRPMCQKPTGNSPGAQKATA